MRLDYVIKNAVLGYTRNKAIVEKAKLEDWVGAQVRQRFPFRPEPGHAWSVLKNLVAKGYIEGMFEGDKLGISKWRGCTLPKDKKVAEQVGFGWEDK